VLEPTLAQVADDRRPQRPLLPAAKMRRPWPCRIFQHGATRPMSRSSARLCWSRSFL